MKIYTLKIVDERKLEPLNCFFRNTSFALPKLNKKIKFVNAKKKLNVYIYILYMKYVV